MLCKTQRQDTASENCISNVLRTNLHRYCILSVVPRTVCNCVASTHKVYCCKPVQQVIRRRFVYVCLWSTQRPFVWYWWINNLLVDLATLYSVYHDQPFIETMTSYVNKPMTTMNWRRGLEMIFHWIESGELLAARSTQQCILHCHNIDVTTYALPTGVCVHAVLCCCYSLDHFLSKVFETVCICLLVDIHKNTEK